MTVRYVEINELGITPVPLSILTPDNQTAKIMVLQCIGQLDVCDQVVNADHGLAEKKHLEFFTLARSRNASLAVTPEYSSPWSVIKLLLATEEMLPRPGSLWVVGCESITLNELKDFTDCTSDLVDWSFETLVPSASQKFLSPIIYIFHNEDALEEQKRISAIIQFKCHDMGGTTFERDKLIKGTKRYIFHNPGQPESIRLVSLVCADAFNFRAVELKANCPHLLIHIQLNTAPYHTDFCRYRREIFNSGNRNNCEVLCLNWAKGFGFLGGDESVDHGGSAYYMHPVKSEKEPNQSDNIINKNHGKGLYLRFSKAAFYSAFLLTPEEVVLEFETTKVSQYLAPPTHAVRTGPQVTATYKWKSSADSWNVLNVVNDGVKEIFEDNGGASEITPSEREKLLVISGGEVSPDLIRWYMPNGLSDEDKAMLRTNYWHKPRNMSSYCLDGNESPKGTLAKFHVPQDIEISGSIAKFSNLRGYLSNSEDLPEILEDYKTVSVEINLDPNEVGSDKIRHNVAREDGKGLATVVDLGAALPNIAQKKFSDIKDTLSPQRLVVWFTHEGQLKMIADKVPEVSDMEEAPDDITRV